MPGAAITITYDGTDNITSSCILADCSFEAQMAAVPGTFTVVVKDPDQTLDFTTGRELTLDVDGQRQFGGYVMQVAKTYFFPADDTTGGAAEVESRQWVLTGVDYNVLLDKLVLRNTSNYTENIPKVTGSPTDASIITTWFDNYFDLPSGFNFSNTTYIVANHTFSSTGNFIWPTQGSTMRQVLDDRLGKPYGSVYWIGADKQFNFIPVQDTVADWGFSDVPNNDPIGVGTPTYGFREGEFTEDASATVNDALVWGGSEWASGGAVVFDRRTNATSITNHGRWQVGENRVGEENYKSQAEVTARAKVIVDGNESGTFAEGSQGLVNPEKQMRLTWFNKDVPESGGDPVHLLPGQVVPIRLYVFSQDAGVTPYAVDLPLRQISISFPTNDATGDTYVQFDGYFGVLMSDPKWLWTFLREGTTRTATTTVVSSADNDTVDPPTGAQYQGVPSPAPDGAETVFTIPFPYIGTTLALYVNGLLQENPDSFDESDPATGEITLTWAPESTDELFVKATLA